MQTPTQPPLSITHLLGWTLGCAVVLGSIRVAANLQGDSEVDYHSLLMQLGYGLTYGTMLSGLGLFTWRRVRGGSPLPTQPGHWLLMLGGLAYLLTVAINLPLQSYRDWCSSQSRNENLALSYAMLASYWGIAALVAFIVYSRLRTTTGWQVLAFTVAASLFANFLVWLGMVGREAGLFYVKGAIITLFQIALAVELLGGGICLISLAIACGLDAQTAERRDWLHWVGAIAAVGLASQHVAMTGWILVLLF